METKLARWLTKGLIGGAMVAASLLHSLPALAGSVALPSIEGHFAGVTPTVLLNLNPDIQGDPILFSPTNLNPSIGSCSVPSSTRETCNFIDGVNAPGHLLHWEVAVQNGNEIAVAFNFSLASLGATAINGLLSLNAGSTALFEILVAEPRETSLWTWAVQADTSLESQGLSIDTSVIEYPAASATPAHESAGPGLLSLTFFTGPADCFVPTGSSTGTGPCQSAIGTPLGSLSTTLNEAVPEPGTLGLLATGLLGVGLWPWRTRLQRRRKL
ncbi:MAG: PEP-CTERM sorting domain-containing protein [Candidatus Tectimicrobiota bacterium]